MYYVYANGTWEEGYCQNCGYESKVPSTKKDVVPMIRIEKPAKKQPNFKRNNR